MSHPRTRPALAALPSLEQPATPLGEVLWMLVAIAAAMLVFRGVLPYFFAQDDFSGLARARGLLPPVVFPWRWISGQLYFDAMRALAGLVPLSYRVVSLTAHAVSVALVYRLCRRFSAAPAAAVGATFFGTHPALFTALYSISGIGELLAAACAIASLLLVTRPGRRAWFAVPLFAASLLSKESTLLVPLVALLPALRGGAAPGAGPSTPHAASIAHSARAIPPRAASNGMLSRAWLRAIPAPVWALLALSLAYTCAFFARDVFGVRAPLAASSAYALRFDRTLLDNLLTYLGWTVKIALPWVNSFTDAIDPDMWLAGIAFALVCAVGFAVAALRQRGWSAGVAWFALALLPVLPLAHHTYHYYLYTPLAGAAVLVAALIGSASEYLRRRGGPRTGAALAAVAALAIALALTLNGARLVRKIETYPFVDPELRADATVDRARIAANAVADLRSARFTPGTQLWFWSPASIARQQAEGKDPALESYWESNVRSALYDGLAARLFVPQVTQTRFVRAFEAAGDSVRYAVYLPNGHLRVGTVAELDSMLHRTPTGAQ